MKTLPALPYADWADTKDTLHLFLQMIGKVRLMTHPKLNHWWHVTLYPHVRGLSTGRIPHDGGGFEILYDMLDHRVVISLDHGGQDSFDVSGLTIAGFHDALFSRLDRLEVPVGILAVPYDNKSTTPFAADTAPRAYNAEAVTDFWRALRTISDVFETYRSRFAGKQTPVHFFWHSFDLVVTRFSGRAFPLEKGTPVDLEAYSHEVVSVGFWPGDDTFPEAAFYGYAYPEPAGLNREPLAPERAVWVEKNGGALAVLKYQDVREAEDPAAAILAFVDSVYDSSARKGDWPAEALSHAFA